MAVKPEDVRSDLARMVGRPLEAAEFGHLISAAVRRLLPYDGWCLFGLDPHSGLRTFQLGQHGIEQRTAELARNESLMPDVQVHRPRPFTLSGGLAVNGSSAGLVEPSAERAHAAARVPFRDPAGPV